jgi:alpha-N-arabinofuranosidase
MPASYIATGGFRPELLKAIKDIKPATIRWPGGSFVGTGDGYNWKTTIGPQHKRVGKVGWDEWDPAAFGIDEFMELCRKVGAEPVIVVYMGPREVTEDRSKWIQDAVDWIEYCNGPATSKWGAVRAANGHPEPYNVKYWEIDNEIWRTPPDHYVEILRAFIPAMKAVDPDIITIACGSGGFYRRFADGDVAIIEQASDLVDFLSPHHYEEADRFAEGLVDMQNYLDKIGAMIAKSKNKDLKIYFSEWNAQSTDWRTGLYAGGVLNVFERHPYLTMACPALFLRHTSAPGWDNAFINFDHKAWFPAPNYLVMKLYRENFAPHLLEVSGDAGSLNLVATKSDDGKRVVLKAVNPSETAMGVRVTLEGGFSSANASMKLVAPDALDARNTIEQPNAVRVVNGKITRTGGVVAFELPRWSVGVVELTK